MQVWPNAKPVQVPQRRDVFSLNNFPSVCSSVKLGPYQSFILSRRVCKEYFMT